VLATLTAGVGIFCLAAGLQGWLLRAATPLDRVLLFGAAGALISPGVYTDIAGVGLLVLVLVVQTLRGRRATPHAVGAPID
jgi:TRAP-type uncharacterized transport system fused permease subunit